MPRRSARRPGQIVSPRPVVATGKRGRVGFAPFSHETFAYHSSRDRSVAGNFDAAGMKVYLDLEAVHGRPGRWAALLTGAKPGAATSRAVELSRVLGYLAREFSTVRKMIVMRRQVAGPTAKPRYVLRPFASSRIPGAHNGQWLALVCEYHESTRALAVVDRELVAMGAVGENERVYSGEIAYESGRLSPAYCDGEAVTFLRGMPVAVLTSVSGDVDALGGPLARWREYLDWRRKIAETKAGETYAYTECDARNPRAVMFYLRDPGDVRRTGQLRQRFLDEELRVGVDPKDTRAPQGTFRRIRCEPTSDGAGQGRLVVEVDFSAGGREAPRLPESGVLRVAMEGELAALDVQLDGLRRLSEGRAANSRLTEWLFDVSKAKVAVGGTDAGWKPALLLNPEQSACVGRALALEDLLLLWGPPGTGKTTVIAEVCSQYARLGRRVLVASQANLAVDQALLRLPASPHVRPAWVSTARRREGSAGEVGRYLCDWLGTVGRAVRGDLAGAQDSPTEVRWTEYLGEWAERCGRVTAEDFSTDDEAFYLKHANVVGATCNETGKPDFVASPRFSSRFDLVIVDEVSKATPPELLLPMLLGRRVMLVGDHRQLPPLFRDEHFEEAVENHELPRDAVERFRDLVTASWFEHAFRDAPESVRCGLRRQYRMHPQIMEAVNLFYADQPLAAGDGETALARERNHGLRLRDGRGRNWLEPHQHLVWFDTGRDSVGRPTRDERVGTSRRNHLEAEACARIVAELVAQPEAQRLSVAVISFYKAQIGLLRDRLRRENLPPEWFDPWRDVNTVDQFQGSERDVVIVSLVRTDARLTGEFVRDFRRINVAFSRARRLLIVLASEQTFGEAKVEVPGVRAGAVVATTAYRSIYELAARAGACVGPEVFVNREERRG